MTKYPKSKLHNIMYSSGMMHIVGWSSLVVMVALMFMLTAPSCYMPTDVQALNGSDYNEFAWVPQEPSTVSLSLEELPALEVVPNGSGAVSTVSARLRISTSSNAGYKIYLGTEDKTNAMTNTSNQTTASIAALSTPTAASGFAANTWGYALTDSTVNSSTVYNPMPVTSSLSYDTTALSGEHYLTFAAKIDTSLPAGQYANTVTISAVANPALITGMMELSYMQDMTSSICAATIGRDGNLTKDSAGSYIITPGNEPTKQLIDIRDGKEYWVSKLADGNCWMTQNLALDLIAGTKLTNQNTDLNSKTEWTISTSTATTIPIAESAPSPYSLRSWNFGTYVLATPSRGVACTPNPANGSNSAPGQDCSDLVNVAIDNWRPTFTSSTAPEGNWTGTNYNTTTGKMESYTYEGPLSVNLNTKEYDAHYLIGNYYQFNTATAESGGTSIVSPVSAASNQDDLVDAKDSICPKGWQLPKSGNNGNTGFPYARKSSFYELFLAYGYPVASDYIVDLDISAPYKISHTPILFGNTNRASQNPAESPISVTRSGLVNPWSGTHGLVGHACDIWSSTTYLPSDANAYILNINDHSIRSSTGYGVMRYLGLSIRCLAR